MDQLRAIWPAGSKFASITWQVNDVCNYRCSYCNPGNFGGRHKNLETETYIENLRELVEKFRQSGCGAFRFFFSGGEPTLWPPLIPVLEYIRREVPGALVAINTNLSRPLEWWQRHHTLFNDIVASFHVEFCDQEKYLANLRFLQDRMDYIVCRMLMHDERFAEVVSFAERLKTELDNYTIEYAALFEAMSPHSEMHHYAEEWKREFLRTHTLEVQRRLPRRPGVPVSAPAYSQEHYASGEIREHNSNRLVSDGQNAFPGWRCWINEAIFITPSGDVRLASCDMGKVVGNMNQRGLTFSAEPVICAQSRCNCGTDIGIRKAHPEFTGSIT